MTQNGVHNAFKLISYSSDKYYVETHDLTKKELLLQNSLHARNGGFGYIDEMMGDDDTCLGRRSKPSVDGKLTVVNEDSISFTNLRIPNYKT